MHGTPCVANGVAHFAGCDEVFHAVDIKTGKERYAASATAYTGASVALVNNVAYFGTFDNQVLALDLQSRKVLWRYEHPDRKFPFYSSAAVIDGTVVLGGRDRMVHALDAKTGKARWTYMTRARIDSSPAIAGGRVYVGSNDGRFYALDLASGKVVWQHDEGAALSASPALAVGTNRDRLDRRPIALFRLSLVGPSPQALLELDADRRAIDLDALDVLQVRLDVAERRVGADLALQRLELRFIREQRRHVHLEHRDARAARRIRRWS